MVPWGLAVRGWMEQPACPRLPAQLGWGDLGTLRAGGVHGGVKRAEWVHIAGAGRRWVGRCAAVHGGSTYTPPDRGSPCKSGHTPVQVCTDPQWDKDRAAQQPPHGVVALTTAQLTGMGHEPGDGDSDGLGHSCALGAAAGSGTLVERGARPVGTERNEASARARWK